MKLLKRPFNSQHIGEENSATMRGGDKHNSAHRAFSSCTPDQPCSRFSPSVRLNNSPVWHVSEMSSAAYLPPPPAPPLRNDSFTATKVHEKRLSIPHSHRHHAHHQKSHSRVTDKQVDGYHFIQQELQAQHGYNSSSKKDFLQVHPSAEDHCSNQLNNTKLYSLSSTDVRQGQTPFLCQPQHQPQRSDESPFYLYPRKRFAPKMQSDGIYYCSLQNLPTNVGIRKQTGSATGTLSSTVLNKSSDGMINYRYCCITSEEPLNAVSDRNPANCQRTMKLKGPLTSPQASENTASSLATVNSNTVKKEKKNPQRKAEPISENQHTNSRVYNQAEQKSLTREHTDTQNGNWISKNGYKICPQMTPLLHSLARENMILTNGTMITPKGFKLQEKPNPISSKQGRRSDRYATTLLNEIQEKRAQLQKSSSAATLNWPEGFEEDLGVWKFTETSTSSSDGSFTRTYKDHLKEAQARVLQATSFQRRDLELPSNDLFHGQLITKSESTNGHVFRIGSRQRFTLDKRVHSFSEPDKMNELGIEEKVSQQATHGSFVDRFQFFERASKPIFSKPIPRKSQIDPIGGKNRFALLLGENERKSARKQEFNSSKCCTPAEELQRLDSFAEYEAAWKSQRKSIGGRTSSRYHSAENILDSGTEKDNSTVCIHERSRSSPSADFYREKISPSVKKPWVATLPEYTLDPEKGQSERTSERDQNQLNLSGAVEFSRGNDMELGDVTQLLHSTQITNGSWPAFSDPHHLRFQASVSKLSSSNKDTETQKLGGHNGNESASEQETTSPSSLSDFKHVEPLPTVVPSPTSKIPFPYCTGGMSAPSKYGYSQDSSVSLQKLTGDNMQHSDIHSNLMENTTEPSSTVENIADTSSDTETKHYLVPEDSLGGTEFTHHLNLPYSPNQPPPLSHNMRFSSSEVQKMDSAETVKLSAAPVGLSEEDEKREELVRDIMGIDKSLVDILDQSKMKTTMDLMDGIYPQGEQLLEGLQQRRKLSFKQSPKATQEKADDKMAAPASLAISSSYYSTSAPKAELLIKMKDMQEQIKEQGSEDELHYNLSNKKQELIDSLSRKLQVLCEAKESLLDDMQDNNILGEEVETTVQAVCKPNELDKFRMFVGDLDKVVSLLLSLSGRLARVENALNNLEEGFSSEEKNTLTDKRKLLIRQHDDAKELKENLDRRERLVYEILTSYLSEERLADYQHFVKMKSALIIEQRKLDDWIKLGEEQLKCLKDSMPLEQRLGC